jgi:hypothetical protein
MEWGRDGGGEGWSRGGMEEGRDGVGECWSGSVGEWECGGVV